MRTVLDELQKRKGQLSTLRFGEDKGWLADLLDWMERQPEIKDFRVFYYFPLPANYAPVSTNTNIFPIASFHAVFKSKSGKTEDGGLSISSAMKLAKNRKRLFAALIVVCVVLFTFWFVTASACMAVQRVASGTGRGPIAVMVSDAFDWYASPCIIASKFPRFGD